MKKLLCILLCCTILGACTSDKRLPPKEGRVSLAPKTELVATKKTLKIGKIQAPTNWQHLYQNTQNNRPHTNDLLVSKPSWTVDIGKNYDLESIPEMPLVVTQDFLYALDGASNVAKIAKTDGQLVWRKELAELSGKAIGLTTNGSQVFVASDQGSVIALTSDGNVAWKKELSEPIRTTPTLNNKLVFVLSAKNLLLALNQKTGKEIWRYKTEEAETFLRGMAHPALAQNVLIVPFTSGEAIAFDAGSGMLLWGQMMIGNQPGDMYELPHILAAPVINGETVFLAGNANLLGAYDLRTGRTKWTQNIGTILTPVVSGNSLFVLTKDHHLLALETNTGHVFWNKEMPHDSKTAWNNLAVSNSQLLVQNADKIYHVDPVTGAIQTTSDADASVIRSLNVGNNSFVLTKRAKIQSYQQGTK